jgi:hypothetical protein
MAQFRPAYDYNMHWEDPEGKREIVPDECPDGCAQKECYAVAGVNSGAWPEDFQRIGSLPADIRDPALQEFYLAHFWTPVNLGGLESQDVANRVYDQGVNGGTNGAVRLLQAALSMLGHSVFNDGVIGPETIAAANACDPEALLAAYRTLRKRHYQSVYDANPDKYTPNVLAAWMRRAEG